MRHVQICTVIEAIIFIVLVSRMQINNSGMTIFRQHSFNTFHRLPGQGHIVKISAAYAYILRDPVHAFHMIVMPAVHTTIYDCSIFQFRHKPGSDVIAVKGLV